LIVPVETGNTLLSLCPLVAARLLPIIMFTPLFGGELASRRFRSGAVVVLSVVFAIGILPTTASIPTGVEYGLLLLKEALIGAILAVLLILAFQLAAAVGSLIDATRGASFSMLQDPSTRQQVSVSGLLLFFLVLTVFITAGGYVLVFGALADSFVLSPPGEFTLGMREGAMITDRLIEASALFFALTVRLAMPVIVVVFLIDIGLGLVNRVASQVQVFFLGMTIKGWVGTAVLFAALAITATESVRWISRLVDAGLSWLGAG